MTIKSQLEMKPAEHLAWIVDQLSICAVAKGQFFTTERLRINAADLADIPREALAGAFELARKEIDYLPGVAEIRRLALVDETTKLDAESRKAWEVLEEFVRKYVGNDINGSYGPEHGWYKNFPRLCDRILDTVRRTGGWRTYKLMTHEDFPFVKKRFFDEYKAWTAVQSINDPSKLLVIEPRPQLVEGKPEKQSQAQAPLVEKLAKPMSAYKPLSPEDLKRRKSEQLAAVRARYGGRH